MCRQHKHTHAHLVHSKCTTVDMMSEMPFILIYYFSISQMMAAFLHTLPASSIIPLDSSSMSHSNVLSTPCSNLYRFFIRLLTNCNASSIGNFRIKKNYEIFHIVHFISTSNIRLAHTLTHTYIEIGAYGLSILIH